MSRPELPRLLHRTLIVLLTVYWLALFVSTHIPQPPPIGVTGIDKVEHYLAFSGLAFLLSAVRSRRRGVTVAFCAGVLAIVAVYGALDELTQPLTHRSCELNDWIADVLGAASGIAAFCMLAAGWRILAPRR